MTKEVKKNPPGWPIKYCKFCGEKLKQKENESQRDFDRRQFCNNSCCQLFTQKKLGHILRSKKQIKKELIQVMKGQEGKWNSQWVRKNNSPLYRAIDNYYGKWSKCLKEIGKLNKLMRNHIYPQKKRLARKVLKFWRKELDIKVGETFYWSNHYINDIINKKICWKARIDILNLLKKKGAIRLIKKGGERKKGKDVGRGRDCSLYILKKTRI